MNATPERDVMKVCLGGHVITESIAFRPDQEATHCPCCGAPTITQCSTCGHAIPGTEFIPGMPTIGQHRPPRHCSQCGAPFPWANLPVTAKAGATIAVLEPLLRRMPRAAHQLRERHDGRPTLRIGDVHDLEDLMRAVLHLHFTDVRRHSRTPQYAAGTRTDFLLAPERVTLALKLAAPDVDDGQLRQQIQQDAAYYSARPECDCLVALVYDPGQRVHDPKQFEAIYIPAANGLQVRCVVAS